MGNITAEKFTWSGSLIVSVNVETWQHDRWLSHRRSVFRNNLIMKLDLEIREIIYNIVVVTKRCSNLFSEIKSSTLKNFIIDNCTKGNHGILSIMVVAPVVVASSCSHFTTFVPFNEMPSLVKEHVHLSVDHGKCELGKNQVKLLHSLCNVTNLELLKQWYVFSIFSDVSFFTVLLLWPHQTYIRSSARNNQRLMKYSMLS
jgi:hypothetical protein